MLLRIIGNGWLSNSMKVRRCHRRSDTLESQHLRGLTHTVQAAGVAAVVGSFSVPSAPPVITSNTMTIVATTMARLSVGRLESRGGCAASLRALSRSAASAAYRTLAA